MHNVGQELESLRVQMKIRRPDVDFDSVVQRCVKKAEALPHVTAIDLIRAEMQLWESEGKPLSADEFEAIRFAP